MNLMMTCKADIIKEICKKGIFHSSFCIFKDSELMYYFHSILINFLVCVVHLWSQITAP